MYEELIGRVKEMIAKGEPLHGFAMDIAIELVLEEMEEEAQG